VSWESELISSLIYDSPVFFIATWADGEIITINDVMLNKLGYTKGEVEGKNHPLNFVPENERQALHSVYQTMLNTKEPLVYKTHLLTKDGHELSVVWHGRATSEISGNTDCIISIGIDITERGHAEERLEHLNKILYTILKINQLIAKESDLEKLLSGICDSLIANRGYHNAWIVILDKSGKLTNYAEAGLGGDFTPMMEELKLGHLTECALRSLSRSEVVVTEDPFQACLDCPLARMYRDRGAMTIRLEYRKRIYGILVASIPRFLIMDNEEHLLFTEIASIISLAIYNIELQKIQEKAEKVRKAQAIALATKAEELQQSRQRIVGVQESLRKEIARELHGSVQNRLIMLQHQLTGLQQKISQDELAAEVDDIHQKLEDLLEWHVRPIARRLFPSVLRRGLIPAIQSLSDHFEAILDIDLNLDEELVQREKTNSGLIAEQTRLAVYRIAEEALTNVVKHAKTAKVSVELKQVSTDRLMLTVKDLGQGFNLATISGGIGLAVMQDYATVTGGTCEIKSTSGTGTEVTATLPLF